MVDICRMEKTVTVMEAWQDFKENILPNYDCTGREMNSIRQAVRDEAKDLLGAKRIRSILQRVAPRRYRFISQVIINEMA